MTQKSLNIIIEGCYEFAHIPNNYRYFVTSWNYNSVAFNVVLHLFGWKTLFFIICRQITDQILYVSYSRVLAHESFHECLQFNGSIFALPLAPFQVVYFHATLHKQAELLLASRACFVIDALKNLCLQLLHCSSFGNVLLWWTSEMVYRSRCHGIRMDRQSAVNFHNSDVMEKRCLVESSMGQQWYGNTLLCWVNSNFTTNTIGNYSAVTLQRG